MTQLVEEFYVAKEMADEFGERVGKDVDRFEYFGDVKKAVGSIWEEEGIDEVEVREMFCFIIEVRKQREVV